LLRKNLEELTSSFGTRLADKKARLTSKEIEICNMIKNGLTSKEIARLLNTSLLTVEKHRNNIRTKLGAVNKGLSLFSILQEL
jgi:DNA-binding CsgD family transcriptional regulator